MILIIKTIGTIILAFYIYQTYLIGGKDIPMSYFGGFMTGFALMGAPMEYESKAKMIFGWVSIFLGIWVFIISDNLNEASKNVPFVLGVVLYFIGLSLLGFEDSDANGCD
jgi:hypothetical protein